ncbi:helix-turn-helix domain-containing protein [Streptomyces sp. NPDC048442]|uniref:helix-turn-helix domain-containing protein n=1 Tax=Streptomyces sp. NPDC048442 TaxID=3154823 RepID=UPI003447D646
MSAVAASAAALIPAPRPAADGGAVSLPPALYVQEAFQWLETSTGRIALDGYSWMQAVHWVAGAGLYEPRRYRSHGPRSFGLTTVRVAQELADLFPCRPGIEYLVRRTGLSERSVEYHLGMLREAGLLAYVLRGTRIRGAAAQASEFARMIPQEYDDALGIRTAGEGTGRRMTGIAEAGRELMAKLAKLAARKVRRPRPKRASTGPAKGVRSAADRSSVTGVSGEARCTPMEGGTTSPSSAGGTYSPPEKSFASGNSDFPTPKTTRRRAGGPKGTNRFGRRLRFARRLIAEIDWLRGCDVRRIAWVSQHVADAGWSVIDVQAWIHFRGGLGASRVHRASGLLATLLAGAEVTLDTPEKRASVVGDWHDAQEAMRRHRIQHIRHQRERFDGAWQAPTAASVRQHVVDAFHTAFRPSAAAPAEADIGLAVEEFEDLEAEKRAGRVLVQQELLAGNPSTVVNALHALGRPLTEELYGAAQVHQAIQLAALATSTLTTLGSR